MKTKVLLIEDNPNDAAIFRHLLETEGYGIEVVSDAALGMARARSGDFDVVLTDLNRGGPRFDEGRDVVAQLHSTNPHLPVIYMTGHHSAEVAIAVIKLGAFDYLCKPVGAAENFRADLVEVIDRAAASKQLMATVKLPGETGTEGESGRDRIIGNSRVMKNVYKGIGRVATKPVTVLIRGETGTGKELVARAIFTHSERRAQPFIVVNCAAIPENLLESELFGHEAGVFTGAKARRVGRFEQAHRGTIFLDEIGDMDVKLQQKLLRVLQENTIERVGGKEPIPVDVRIIAATHRDLELAMQENEFRQDLYFRLNVAVISLPPLRDRQEDITLSNVSEANWEQPLPPSNRRQLCVSRTNRGRAMFVNCGAWCARRYLWRTDLPSPRTSCARHSINPGGKVCPLTNLSQSMWLMCWPELKVENVKTSWSSSLK